MKLIQTIIHQGNTKEQNIVFYHPGMRLLIGQGKDVEFWQEFIFLS